jgi:TonB family protein
VNARATGSDMTAATDRPAHSIRSRGWFRHGVAALAALAVNAALVLFLIAWTRRTAQGRPPAILAVPVEVTDLEPQETDLSEAEAAPQPLALEPPIEPPLPALPQPEIPAPDMPLDAPLPVEVPAAAFTGVPLYVAEAAGPSPIGPGAIRPRPTPRVVRPATRSVGATRGAVMLQPPDLSDYYPRRALLRGITGRTTIRLTIDEAGRAGDVQVVESEPAGVFDHAAGRVGRSLRFRPALRNNRPVRTTVSLKLIWRLEE